MSLKHIQVREYLRGLIADAAPGTPTPSERDLVQRFGVARMTVRQAMDALVAEGLIERIAGRGSFVTPPPQTATRLTSFTEEMQRRGLRPDSQTLIARIEHAGPGVARALNLTEGDPVIHWRRLRSAAGARVCVQDVYLNEILLPGFLAKNPLLLPASLYDDLAARGLRPTWAEDSITAGMSSADESELLDLEAGAVVLRQSRRATHTHEHAERVVEVSKTTYRTDRHTLMLTLDGHGPTDQT